MSGRRGSPSRPEIARIVVVLLLCLPALTPAAQAGAARLTEMFPIDYGTTLHGVFFHDGVMFATGMANLLVRIDPETGTLLEVVSPLLSTHHGGHLHGATLGPDGTFYVVEAHSDTIYQLRLDDYSVVSTLPAPTGEPYSLAYRNGVLWVGPHGYSTPDGLPLETIYAIDPRTGEILDQFQYAQIDAHGMIWMGDYLWILDNFSDSIHQVDPATGALADTFRLSTEEWYGLGHDGTRLCGDSLGTFFEIELFPTICPPPGAVVEARFTDKTTITWSEPAQLGGLNVVYDAIRSADPDDFVALSTCVESDDDDLTADDTDTPAAGTVYYYLVRAENACPSGVGPLGNGTGGPLTGRSCP